MGDVSLLKAPYTPVEMKVFHGGGLIVPVTPDNTTLPQPVREVPMHEFKGGGLKEYVPSREGPRTLSLLNEPEKPAEMKVFKGGARKILDESSIAPFRGIKLNQIPKELKHFVFILQILSQDEKDKGSVSNYEDIPILPVLISDNKLYFLKGEQINTIKPDELFVFNEKGKQLTYDDVKGKETTNFLLFYTKANVAGLSPSFISSENLLTSNKEEDVKKPENLSKENKIPLSDEHIGKTILSSGFRVRYVIDAEKEDFKNLKLTESEEKLFQSIFGKQSTYVKEWIKKLDINKESFYEFWKLYVNKDGGSFRFLTSREYQTIQGFLLKVLETYRKELQERALTYLRGFESVEGGENFSAEKPARSAGGTSGTTAETSGGAPAKPAEGTAKPAEGTAKPAEGTAKPAEGTAKPAEGTAKPAEGTAKPAEGTAKPAEQPATTAGTTPAKPAEGTSTTTGGAPAKPAEGTSTTTGAAPAKPAEGTSTTTGAAPAKPAEGTSTTTGGAPAKPAEPAGGAPATSAGAAAATPTGEQPATSAGAAPVTTAEPAGGAPAKPAGSYEEKEKLEEEIKRNIGSIAKVTRSITEKLQQASIDNLKLLKEKLKKEIENPSMSGTSKPSYTQAIKGTILEVKRGGRRTRKQFSKTVSKHRFHTSRKARSKRTY